MNNYALVALSAAVAMAAPASAEDLPETKLNVVGAWGMVSMYTDFTMPFYTETLPAASNGKVTAEIKPFNELGLDGSEIVRLVQQGTLQFASTPMGYMIGDNAINGGNDLPGMVPDIETARAISDAYKPVLEEVYAEYLVLLESATEAAGFESPRGEALCLMSLLEGESLFTGEGRRWEGDRALVRETIMKLIDERYGEKT